MAKKIGLKKRTGTSPATGSSSTKKDKSTETNSETTSASRKPRSTSSTTRSSKAPAKKQMGATAQFLERMNKDRRFKGKAQIKMANEIRTPYALRRPTGVLSLDIAMGGGFHAGGAVEMYGAQSAGKTFLMWKTFARNQELHGDDSRVVLLSTELRPDKGQARLAGFCVAYSEEEIQEMEEIRILNGYEPFTEEEKNDLRKKIGDFVCITGVTADVGLDALVEALREGIFQIAAIDSLGSLLTKAVDEGDVGDAHYAGPSRIMTQFQNKVAPLYSLDRPDGSMLETTLLGINQVRCVASSELVVTERGIVSAWEARNDSTIMGENGKLEPIGAEATSVQVPINIETNDGRMVSYGPEHPVRIYDGTLRWKKAADLEEGDWVALPRKIDLPEVEPEILPNGEVATADFCRFLGMWFSDGCLIPSDKKVSFTEKSEERNKALLETVKALGWTPRKTSYPLIDLGTSVYSLLEKIGCERGAENKTIPSVISGKEQWRAFLNGMFDSHVIHNGFYITVENPEAAKAIHMALLGFGIHAKMSNGKGSNSKYVYVAGKDAHVYLDEIGFAEKTKEEKVKTRASKNDSSRGKRDIVPMPKDFIENAMKTSGWENVHKEVKRRAASIKCQNLNLSSRDYIHICEVCDIEPVLAKFYWVPVRSVMEGESEVDMVDFDVPGSRTFIAGGIVTHNSNIGGGRFDDSEKSAMGSWAWKHGQLLSLRLVKGGKLKDANGKLVGHKVRWDLKKGKAGTHDGKAGEYMYFHFPDRMQPVFWKDVEENCYGGVGVLEDVVETAKNAGILKASGAWLEHPTSGLRANGAIAFAQELAQDEEIADQIRKECFRHHKILVRYK